MNELTSRPALELGGRHFQRARILALADSAEVGIALIDAPATGHASDQTAAARPAEEAIRN